MTPWLSGWIQEPMAFDALQRLFRGPPASPAPREEPAPAAPDARPAPVIDSAFGMARHHLLLGNAMAYGRLDPARLRSLPEYRRVADVSRALRTYRVEGVELVRLGGDADGAYLMLDSLRPPAVTAGYSFGVGNEVSWDVAVGERGIDLVLHDHTVNGPPQPVPRGRFVKQGVCGATRVPDCRTVAEVIAENGHLGRTDLVLKMDVENAEWAVLDEISADTLGQFAQIAIEFHRLLRVALPDGHAEVMRGLEKLAITHVPIHVHGNNVHLPLWIGDLILPDVIEVTYVRRADYEGRLVPRDEAFPTDLDRPNVATRPDVFLGWTFTGGEEADRFRSTTGPS